MFNIFKTLNKKRKKYPEIFNKKFKKSSRTFWIFHSNFTTYSTTKSQFVDQQISSHKHIQHQTPQFLTDSQNAHRRKSNTFSNLFVQIQQKYSKTFSIHVYDTQSHDFIVCLTTTTKWSSPTASISSHADYVEKNSLLQSQSKHQRDDIEILNAENKIKSLFKRIFYLKKSMWKIINEKIVKIKRLNRKS